MFFHSYTLKFKGDKLVPFIRTYLKRVSYDTLRCYRRFEMRLLCQVGYYDMIKTNKYF